MNFLGSVQHGHCAMCGDKASLFVLRLHHGEAPRLDPKLSNVHAGICRACWKEIGAAVQGDLVVQVTVAL